MNIIQTAVSQHRCCLFMLHARLATVVRFANAEQCIDVRRDTANWASITTSWIISRRTLRLSMPQEGEKNDDRNWDS